MKETLKKKISLWWMIIFVTSDSRLQENIFCSMHISEYRRRMRRTENIGVSDKRMHVDTVTYSVDNKLCQGAKAITTWPRALSRKSRAFPFVGVASRENSLKGELN